MAQLTVQQAFDLAVRHHDAGQLREAEPIYQQIIAVLPRHAEALHRLGILAQQVGNFQAAVDFISRSISASPNVPEAHNNLSVVLRKTGEFSRAIESARRAIAMRQGWAEAHYNLGLALKDHGDRDAAILEYQHALKLKPNYIDACNNLGIALGEKGELDQAIALYRKIISIDPAYAKAHLNLGVALHEQKKLDESRVVLERLIQRHPDYADAHNAMGSLQKEFGQLDRAIASYQKAIGLRPDYLNARTNLALAFCDSSQPDAAIAVYQEVIALKPDDPERYHDLGNAYRQIGQLEQAISAYRQALALRPDYAEVMSNLGVTLREAGRLQESIDVCRQAVAVKPDYAAAYNNLGISLREQNEIDEAVAALRKAAECDSSLPQVYTNLATALASQGLIEESITNGRRALSLNPRDSMARSGLVFSMLLNPACDAHSLAIEHRAWDLHHGLPLRHLIQPHANDRNPDRRLRIGYLSPDFKSHVLSQCMAPLLLQHDRSQFEICCYSQVRRGDVMTDWLKQRADRWCDIFALNDEKAAAKIREDQIDVLVDLSLHSSDNRLTVFARKPAPVQLTYLGYCGTTGLSAIDYRISDPYLDPPGTDLSLYSEKTIHLENSYWCYSPNADAPEVQPPPQATNGFITFGCLNNFAKVSLAAQECWCSILQQVPGSRLLLHAYPGSHRQRAIDRFTAAGIDAGRIEFFGFQPTVDYLKTYHRIDVGVDPFPYAGGITSCDSLWMGLPIVTLAGKQSPVSRGGCSVLQNVGLGDLIAGDRDAYISKAVQLAGDLPRLVELRRTLRTRMKQSPLMDLATYTRSIEAIYRNIWRQWCENPPGLG